MLRSLSAIVFCIALTTLGLGAGWHFGQHAAEDHEHEDDHDHDMGHDDHDDHDDDHAHEDEEEVELSEETLRSLGVRIGSISLKDFVRTIDVRAVLVDRPENHRALVTPIGGIVRDVHIESGQVVAAGAPILSLTRDPIPLRGQETVMGILLPVRETVHEAVAAMRSARTDLGIAEREMTRVKDLAAPQDDRMPGLFASRLVELGHARERAAQRLANAEAELRHHGLENAEIAEIAKGDHAPAMLNLWRRVLRKHGLWGELQEAILARLPADARDKPWPIALLAELSLQGLARPGLLTLLEAHPAAAPRFREVGALLLDGRSIESVSVIAEMGALEPEVVLRAPPVGAEHWDVERLLTRAGQSVAAGAPVAELHDPRRLWLRVEPIGGEVAHVRRAVKEHLACEAVPILKDAAPALQAVHFRRLARHGEHGAVAYAEIPNEVLLQEEKRRSWSLHAGTEFLVRLPLETLAGRIVLPIEAVVRNGPDRVVYILEEHDEDHEDHEHEDDHAKDAPEEDHHHFHFHPVPVHVEVETQDVVVIAANAALSAGQEVVVDGAFALHLALQQGKGGDDAHGHGHSHH